MNVLLVMGVAVGGVQRHVRQAADLLAQAGISVTIAGPQGSVPKKRDSRVHAIDITISSKPHLFERKTIKQLQQLMGGFDVVHAHGLRAGGLCAMAIRALKDDRPRFVVTLHNQLANAFPAKQIGAYLLKQIAQEADLVLAVSSDLHEAARDTGAKRCAIAVIPNVREMDVRKSREQVRNELGIATGTAFILTTARLAPQKGLPLLLGAAEQLTVDARWYVAGEGSLRDQLQSDIKARKLPVTLLGARDDIDDLLAAADLFVSTSYWEGQGIAVQEALRAGCPIVATDVGEIAPTVRDAAVLVPLDAGEIATQVNELLSDSSARSALREKALRRTEELAKPEDLLRQLVAAYEGAV